MRWYDADEESDTFMREAELEDLRSTKISLVGRIVWRNLFYVNLIGSWFMRNGLGIIIIIMRC